MRFGARNLVLMAISTFTKSVDSVVAVGAVGAGGGESSSTCFPLDFFDLFALGLLFDLFISKVFARGCLLKLNEEVVKEESCFCK